MKLWFFTFVFGCGLLVGCGPYDPKAASDLAQCYQAEFGELPPAKVKVVNARQMVVRDWGAQWLRLEVSGDALDSVVLSRGFKRVAATPRQFASVERYTPKWWQLSPGSSFEFYEHTNWTKGTWSSSRAVIAVDRASGVVLFLCDRND